MFSAHSGVERSFELAWADAAVELRHLGMSAAQSHRFQRLLTAVLWPKASLRAPLAAEALQGEGRRVLWSQGLSDDLPLLIARIDDGEPGELCRELLLAHEFFRLNNQALELLLLNEEPAGYLQPVQDQALALVHARHAHAQLDRRGGIFVRRSSHLSERERNLLLAAGRVVLPASQGSLGAPAAPRSRAHGRARAGAAVEASRGAAARARGERAGEAPRAALRQWRGRLQRRRPRVRHADRSGLRAARAVVQRDRQPALRHGDLGSGQRLHVVTEQPAAPHHGMEQRPDFAIRAAR